MVPHKRIFIAAAGALAATLALAACGSEDYGLTNAQSAAIKAGPTAAPAEELAASQPTEGPIQESDEAPAQESDAEPAQESDEADAAAEAETDAEQPVVAPKVGKPVGKVTNKLIAKTVPRMGNVVTDAKGWVLYRFDKDKAAPSKSNCVGDCAIIWPPLLADETLELSGIDASKVDTVERADGGLQVTLNGWPLYRYLGDKTPGAWKGQNVGGVWFVVQKDGRKNLTCLPKISKPVPLPATPTRAKKSEVAAVAPLDDESDAGYDSY